MPPKQPVSDAFPYSFGWIPDLPDTRDYTKDHPKVAPLLAKKPSSLQSSADLRPFCPPVFDQGEMGSCTANAAAALLSYHNRRSFGKTAPLSRMFIYKGTRDLMQAQGDSGACIRTTMGALSLFGAPPERYWGYDGSLLDSAPPAFCYSYAANYQATSYFRLDEKSAGIRSEGKGAALAGARGALAQGLPAMFGFRVFESIRESARDGKIPYPERGEKLLGGHAVLAVGYDDALTIKNGTGDNEKTGAFLIRNSWGEGWGEKGYGWLPYDYLLAGLAEDFWCLVKAEWIDTEQFGV